MVNLVSRREELQTAAATRIQAWARMFLARRVTFEARRRAEFYRKVRCARA